MTLLRSLAIRPALAAAALLLSASALAAQAVPAPAAPAVPSMITGRVTDATTGRPLRGVRVAVERQDRQTVTDPNGAFTLRDMEPGLYAVTFSLMGYTERREDVVVGEAVQPLAVALAPDAVVLEGLTVQSDRFRRRRNGLPYRVSTIDRDEFIATTARTAKAAVMEKAMLSPCGGTDRNCVRVRGQNRPVILYIDERPAVNGLSELEEFDPSELYLVEVYRGGAMIRIYTVEFMQRAARTRLIPEPIQI